MSTPHIAALGIDVGGTGIKGAVVDIATGRLISKRRQSATPQPATPATVSTAIAELVTALDFTGPIGIAFPSAINDGAVLTAANLDKSWIGQHIGTVIDGHLPARATYLNDADAATLAEVRYGIGRDTGGLTIMVTFGTGIGTGLAHSGRLVPNAELGHIEIDGVPAEIAASAVARERNNLTWEQWA